MSGKAISCSAAEIVVETYQKKTVRATLAAEISVELSINGALHLNFGNATSSLQVLTVLRTYVTGIALAAAQQKSL
ncbi:MAG: hypothetical protein RBT19_12100 [Tenuifilaceae bacterium]|jgi:hypothetical protein|uniref:hypothetical protein n=1 Tax=Perlabentimonas gracilis TaxID=2715279 RepID=UPI001408BC47|nr:hypothetical protein [Perlabentimonas gracilis]MDX9771098.1 hypothetical protein [Tenuifilaceae bacterium]NHB69556.1 hypothetical protein [Perlabentimonas gracilis]